MAEAEDVEKSLNFIQQIITDDKENGINGARVHTRFPPDLMGTYTLDMLSLYA